VYIYRYTPRRYGPENNTVVATADSDNSCPSTKWLRIE